MAKSLEQLDENFAVPATIDGKDLMLYDVKKPPFEIYGLHDPTADGDFRRMPDDVAASVSEGVRILARHTSGGRVRFATDSPYVAIKAVMPSVGKPSNLSLPGQSGLDLYVDAPDGSASIFHRAFIPPYGMTNGYESLLPFYESGMHYVTIDFPLYNPLTALYIGVKAGSYLGKGAPYRDVAPIVYYGSSITQGGCASRAGNAYPNMVTRALGIDHRNFGFSGNAKGERAMAEYLASLEMSAFVCDYDHNAPTDVLRATHRALYDTIREKHPTVPYVILSRPDPFRITTAFGDAEQSITRRHIILDTFHYARDKGDKNISFIDGESIFRGPFEGDCTVDGTHPNDLGFSRMAEAVTAVLHRCQRDGKIG
ncbi:MAG: hypothetical protein J6B77_02840 [Clostridia bacterium]|nr:hypothetical protein [Clostridia bacterium]